MGATGREPLSRKRATAYAVALHAVLLTLLFVGFAWHLDSSAYVLHNGPHVIHAYMVGLKPAHPVPEKRPQAQSPVQKRIEARAKAAAARRQALLRAQEKAQAEAAAKAKAEAAAKAKAEAAARRQALLRAQEKAQAEAAAKAKAEAAAKAKAEAAARAAAARGIVDRYRALIQAKVSAAWVAPPGLKAGLQCTVAVHVISGGQVLSARIVQGSGNAVFDRSVLAAIYNAAPLPVPRSPARLRYLRHFKFVFTAPE